MLAAVNAHLRTKLICFCREERPICSILPMQLNIVTVLNAADDVRGF